jgi:hypothetical protein
MTSRAPGSTTSTRYSAKGIDDRWREVPPVTCASSSRENWLSTVGEGKADEQSTSDVQILSPQPTSNKHLSPQIAGFFVSPKSSSLLGRTLCRTRSTRSHSRFTSGDGASLLRIPGDMDENFRSDPSPRVAGQIHREMTRHRRHRDGGLRRISVAGSNGTGFRRDRSAPIDDAPNDDRSDDYWTAGFASHRVGVVRELSLPARTPQRGQRYLRPASIDSSSRKRIRE